MKKISLLIVIAGLIASQTIPMDQPQAPAPYQLKLGGSLKPWYIAGTTQEKPISNLVKLTVNNKTNGLIFTVQQGQGNYWWAIISPGQSHVDEWLSMDKLTQRPHYTIFANTNNIYTVDFEKMKKWTTTAPYFSALLQKVKPTPRLQQILNNAQQKTMAQINQLGPITPQKQNELLNILKAEILPQVENISNNAYQIERAPIQQLDDVLPGAELELDVDNNSAQLRK